MIANWIEVKRFLVDNRFIIIISSIIFGILFAVGLTFLPDAVVNESEQGNEIDEFTEFEDSKESQESPVAGSQPARFKLFIEMEDGSWYTNNNLLIEYFRLERTEDRIKDETGVDIDLVRQEFLESGEDSLIPIHAFRSVHSGLITLTVNTGDNEDNLEVAEFIYGLFINNEIDFLEDTDIYSFISPRLSTDTDTVNEEVESELVPDENINDESTSTIIRNGIIGLVVGTAFAIGFAFLRALFGKKLNYSFTYAIEDKEKFILYDKHLNNEEFVAQFIGVPYGERKVILSESNLDNATKSLLSGNKNVSFKNSQTGGTYLKEVVTLADFDSQKSISEVIFCVLPYNTTRKWYLNQKKLMELYDVPVKIVQINN